MPDISKQGPLVDDAEVVYRAILYPWQWAEKLNRPSSAAFDEEIFSVDIASRTTPEQTASRFKMVLKLVEFNCGEARALGFETRDEPDEQYPDNLSHAHVYFLEYHSSAEKQRKKKARKLAEHCQIVENSKLS